MKQAFLANLLLLNISGALSPSDAASIGTILAIGMMIALIVWVAGKFWFIPYLEHHQKIPGKSNSPRSAKTNSRKATHISQQKIARKD